MRLNESSWVCPEGHSFDIASKGYTNLLPVQHKRSRDPGDHKAMVTARQRFLNAGHYREIAKAVNTMALSSVNNTPFSCLDAGCGEGYYLRALAAAGTDGCSLAGVDISKWAIQAAARQGLDATWLVGSNARLPVLGDSLDCVLCMFGFPVYPEFLRVLKPGAVLIQVDTGTDHLRELRNIIYAGQKLASDPDSSTIDGFTLNRSQQLRYTLELDSAATIADLLAMTPHYYRASSSGREKLEALNRLSVTVDIKISCYRSLSET